MRDHSKIRAKTGIKRDYNILSQPQTRKLASPIKINYFTNKSSKHNNTIALTERYFSFVEISNRFAQTKGIETKEMIFKKMREEDKKVQENGIVKQLMIK